MLYVRGPAQGPDTRKGTKVFFYSELLHLLRFPRCSSNSQMGAGPQIVFSSQLVSGAVQGGGFLFIAGSPPLPQALAPLPRERGMQADVCKG